MAFKKLVRTDNIAIKNQIEALIERMIHKTYSHYQVHKAGVSLEAAITEAVKQGYKLGKSIYENK